MPSTRGSAVARWAVAVGFGAIAALPIGLLALGSAAVARGLAALTAAGGGFRTISSAARRGIGGRHASRENQAACRSQKQKLLHHVMPSYVSCRMRGAIRPFQADNRGVSSAPFSLN